MLEWGMAHVLAQKDQNGESHNLWQVDHIPHILRQRLRDDESPHQRLLRLLPDHLGQHALQVLHVIVLVPSHRAPRDLDALADGVVGALVRDDDVSSLGKGGDHAGDGAEGLRVDDARRHAQVVRDVGLAAHVHVLGAVEARGPAGPDAISAQRLDGFFLEAFVGDEVVVVVGGEVGDGPAVGELALGSRRSVRE